MYKQVFDPVGDSLDMGLEGAAFGLFPIMWIVVNAVWIYNMTERTGHFAVLRRSFATISDDQRIQAIIIAFSFGALIEGLAGFGTPVAITSVMLIALGFSPLKAAALSLIGNTAPVAFGSIATPIITLAAQTDLPMEDLGAMVGRQTPILALIVPLVLVGVVDGGRGVRQTWPAAMVAGVSFAIAQFVCSNYISVELTDIIASLFSTLAIVVFLRAWRPAEPLIADRGPRPAMAGAAAHDPALERSVRLRDQERDSTREQIEAFAPYIIIVAVFAIAKLIDPVEKFLFELSGGTGFDSPDDKTVNGFDWPGLDIKAPDGEAPSAQTFAFSFWDSPGTIVLICGLLTIAALRINLRDAIATYGRTLDQLKWAIVTVMAVLGLAYVMNLTGMTATLGQWIAGAGGGVVAFLSSIIGWLGVAITGSDTSSNALFGALQVEAAKEADQSGVLLASANSSGGVLGKMISPQNLAIGAAAVALAGREGDIFRRVVFWSIVLTLVMCVIVYLQSTAVLDWMVVK